MGRLWFESHNLPYSLYLFEETLFTPCSRGIYYRETTCFAYGRAAGLKRLLLGICDRLLDRQSICLGWSQVQFFNDLLLFVIQQHIVGIQCTLKE